jgi:hypothetical protein
LGEGRQGTGRGIAEGAQGHQQCGQEDMNPLIGFALSHAEEASLDDLEAIRLQIRKDEGKRNKKVAIKHGFEGARELILAWNG